VQKIIYTIGSSNRTLEEFISLCREFKLRAIVDVRRFPVSKFDHFKKDNLTSHLQEGGGRVFLSGKRPGGIQRERI